VAFVLVHSPLLGPRAWAPVADELERHGARAAVPSLLRAASSPSPRASEFVEIVRRAAGELPAEITLVGHSGAGLLLAAIAGAVGPRVNRIVFVDAGLPARTGETPLGETRFLESLRARAVDGVLPPWSAWWDGDVLAELVPDARLRAELVAELPSLPLSYFEQAVTSPEGWDRAACEYVLLSEAYTDVAAEARHRGWPVHEVRGEHLHIVVAPDKIADVLLGAAAATATA
jgi:pimeloyl-ACP methyl ester carboxylesterase